MDTRKFRNQPDGAAPEPLAAAADDLSPAEARGILVRAVRLLDAINDATREVVASTKREELLAVFVQDRPVVINPLPDPTKRPRGRAHPLIALFKLGISSARLVGQMLRTLGAGDEPDVNPQAAVNSLEGLFKELTGMAKDLGVAPKA